MDAQHDAIKTGQPKGTFFFVCLFVCCAICRYSQLSKLLFFPFFFLVCVDVQANGHHPEKALEQEREERAGELETMRAQLHSLMEENEKTIQQLKQTSKELDEAKKKLADNGNIKIYTFYEIFWLAANWIGITMVIFWPKDHLSYICVFLF